MKSQDTPLSSGKPLARRHSTDSEASPESKAPLAKKLNMATSAEISEMNDKLTKILEEQASFRQSLEQRFTNMERNLTVKIENECKKIKEDMLIEISTVRNEIELVRTSVGALESRVMQEIEGVRERVSTIETTTGIQREPFDSEVTIIVTGLKHSDSENLKAKAEALIHEGIGDSTIEVIDVFRTPSRNNRPGIVKIQLLDKDTKIKVLRNKVKLAADDRYRRVFIRSSQSHTERLLHLNTMTMLREIGQEAKYRVTGSGRVVLKSDDELRPGHAWGPAHPPWSNGAGPPPPPPSFHHVYPPPPGPMFNPNRFQHPHYAHQHGYSQQPNQFPPTPRNQQPQHTSGGSGQPGGQPGPHPPPQPPQGLH